MPKENQFRNSCPECFFCCRIFMLLVTMQTMFLFFLFAVVPEPVAFYPLNARYKAAEKENRQPKGILRHVDITTGPYNEPGGAYMFYGNPWSFIYFPNKGGLDTQFSITLMCWVQHGGQNGELFSYGRVWVTTGVRMGIEEGKLFFLIVQRGKLR